MKTQSDSTSSALLRDAALERLPDALYAAVVTGPGHDLEARIAGVADLRAVLLEGRVPSAHTLPWPASPIKEKIVGWLNESGLPRYCRETPDLTDAVMLSIIDETTAADTRTARNADQLFRELVAIEEKRRQPQQVGGDEAKKKAGPPLSQADKNKMRAQAEQQATAKAGEEAAAAMAAAWGERFRAWAAIEEVFGELGGMCGLGWDLSRTVLRHTGWQDAKRLAELLKKLPQIQDLVRTLGRMQSTEKPDETPILERLFGPVRRIPAELRDIDTPAVPHDTRGVERSGDIARMLPSEAVLFMRPALRLLWHAKRAERALATYRVRGVQQERLIADDAGTEARDAERRKKKQDRGPIIVCLDTSGSMQGAPETVAKAVTLEAVRIATAEKRECFLYAFSGPTQVAEFDLSDKRGGVQALLEFLGCSFHGGTDVAEPIARALKRVETAKWSRADAIIVSDGEFPVPSATSAAVASARKSLHLRVHGLLIGAGHSAAMTSLCDPVHVFKDWNALRQGQYI
ncbi:MAG: VWA domain-containing protein [Phycisphaerales bacterium]